MAKATSKAQAKATSKPKAQAKAKRFTPAQAKKVVTMRDRKTNPASWVVIGEAVGCAPRTARRLYDSVKGQGAHHGLLTGKGGRTVTKAQAKKAA